MLGGFNTNVRYRGRKFHVQTEDNGRANPKIITLLYEGGVILTSRKRGYEDHLESESLEEVVREFMEEQHREMLAELKSGVLDEEIGLEGDSEQPASIEAAQTAELAKQPEFGEGIISEIPLDDLVLGQLAGG